MHWLVDIKIYVLTRSLLAKSSILAIFISLVHKNLILNSAGANFYLVFRHIHWWNLILQERKLWKDKSNGHFALPFPLHNFATVKALRKPSEKLITILTPCIDRMGLGKLSLVSVPLSKEWLLKSIGWNSYSCHGNTLIITACKIVIMYVMEMCLTIDELCYFSQNYSIFPRKE